MEHKTEAVKELLDHLRTLDPAEADAMAGRTADEVVAMLRRLLGTTRS